MKMKVFFIAILLLVCAPAGAYYDYRNVRVDSLEAALSGSDAPKGEALMGAYAALMRGYLAVDLVKAEEYGRKALALSYEHNALNVRQDALRHLGLLRYAREEFDEAIACFEWALAVADTMESDGRYKPVDIDDARSSLYGSIANVYNMQDKAHLAISYYQRALTIFERHGWLESQAVLYHNIGELYLIMGNVAEAERNYVLAVEKGDASGDSLMMALPRKGLLNLYVGRGDHAQARAMAEACYAYYHAHREVEVDDYSEVLAAMARMNLMDGHENLAAARANAKEAESLVTDEMMFENQSNVYAACCEVAMAEGRWQEALDYGLRCVHPDSLATNSDVTCYKLLADIYTELGDKAQAREYVRKMYDVMTRYATDHYQSGLSQMEVLYETEKKETQIAALDRERSLYRWLLVAAVTAIAALVAGTVLMVVVHRRRKALLAAKVALETETKERHILAQDLHDGIGGMLALLRMKSEGGENIELLDKIIAELRRTAHHLMPEELLRSGLASALHDFAVSVPGASFQNVGETAMDKDRELVLYRCAYELVGNAMKHAGAEHIAIQLVRQDGEVTLTVSDDGKGLGEMDNGQWKMGNGQGMGLKNIRERIAPYRGRLDIVSAGGRGTDVNITLPL